MNEIEVPISTFSMQGQENIAQVVKNEAAKAGLTTVTTDTGSGLENTTVADIAQSGSTLPSPADTSGADLAELKNLKPTGVLDTGNGDFFSKNKTLIYWGAAAAAAYFLFKK